MTASVRWRRGEAITPSDIRSAEQALSVQFPAAYSAIILQHNGGGRPSSHCYGGRMFGYLLGIRPGDRPNIDMLMKTWSDRLPTNVIPFAVDPGGNALCFDFRGDSKEPMVAYFDHEYWEEQTEEERCELVARSFAAFLGMLEDCDV